MALETYQDLVETDPNEVQDASFAKISEIYDDGVTLIFDGMEEATQKRYQTNSFVVFKRGDRVRVIKDSGTYVVEYPVGAPRKSFDADYATKAGTASNANYASSAGSVSGSVQNATNSNYALMLRNQASSSGSPLALRYYNSHFYVAYNGGTWYRIDNA